MRVNAKSIVFKKQNSVLLTFSNVSEHKA